MHKNPARAQSGPHKSPKLQQELDTRYNRTCRGNAAGSKQLKLNQHNRNLFIMLSQNKKFELQALNKQPRLFASNCENAEKSTCNL